MYDELKSNIICKCVGHLIVINIGLNTVILFCLITIIMILAILFRVNLHDQMTITIMNGSWEKIYYSSLN